MLNRGGLDLNAAKYSEDVRELALSLIGHAREIITLPDETERGLKFNHNEGVLWRLESMATAEDFLHDPLRCVEAALIDASRSDHWYSHEKDWGNEEVEDEEIEAESEC